MGDKACRTWREQSADRRDERNVKDPELDNPPRKGGHKDKKKWCGGKVGREHKPECFIYHDLHKHNWTAIFSGKRWSDRWRVLVCTVCGKELAYYYGNKGLFSDQKKPDWVDK